MMATEDSSAMRAAVDSISNHRSGSPHSQSTQDRALAASRKSTPPSIKKTHSNYAALGLAEGTGITDELVHLAIRNKVQVRTSDWYRHRLAQCGMADPVSGQHGVIVKAYEAGEPGLGLKCDVMWDSGRGLTGYHTRPGIVDLVVAPARGSSKELDASIRSAPGTPASANSAQQIADIASIVNKRPENLILDVTVGYLGQAPPPIVGGTKSLWSGEQSLQEELKSTPKASDFVPTLGGVTPKGRKPAETAKDLAGKLAKQVSSSAPLSQFTVDSLPKISSQVQPSLQQFVPTGNTPQKSGYKRPHSASPSPTGSSDASVSTTDRSPSSESSSPPGSAAPMASARSTDASNLTTARYRLPAPNSGGSSVDKKDLDGTSEEEVQDEAEASWDGQMGYV